MTGDERVRRSQSWVGAAGRAGMLHRSWLRNQGQAVATTWSELAPCNVRFNQLAEAVQCGVWHAGGLPLVFPAMPTGELLIRPTAMYYRNLLAFQAEERST